MAQEHEVPRDYLREVMRTVDDLVAIVHRERGRSVETFTVRNADGGTFEISRERLEWLLNNIAPNGMRKLRYFLSCQQIDRADFEAACWHFGLGHYLVDVSRSDVQAELEARRARGAPPTNRIVPLYMDLDDRERIDAALDAYARRVAEARSAAGAADTVHA